MAIVRRFDVDPRLQALLAFVGTKAQQEAINERIEAQTQQRSRERLATSIGGAIGDIGSAPFKRQLLDQQQDRKLQDSLALIGARGSEGIRRDEERFNREIEAYRFEQTGDTVDDVTARILQDAAARPQQVADTQFLDPRSIDIAAGTTPPPPVAPSGDPASLVGPPAPGALPFAGQERQAQQGAVQQALADQEAGFRLDFTPQAKAKIMQLEAAASKIEESDSLSEDEKAGAYAEITRQKARIRRTKIPADPPPTKFEQLFQSGYAAGDPNGRFVIRGEDGRWRGYNNTPADADTDKQRTPWGKLDPELQDKARTESLRGVLDVHPDTGEPMIYDMSSQEWKPLHTGKATGEEDIAKQMAALAAAAEERLRITPNKITTQDLVKQKEIEEKKRAEFAFLESNPKKLARAIIIRAEQGEDVSTEVAAMMDVINKVYPRGEGLSPEAKKVISTFFLEGLIERPQ